MVLCNFRIQHINNLSFLRLSQRASTLSCKQCAISVFNKIITYHSLDSVRELSLLCKQCATSVFNKIITYHFLDSIKEPPLFLLQALCNFKSTINNLSFLTRSEGAFFLSSKQCASYVFNILIFYHSLLGVK